jgi:hypothetical protein
VDTYTKVAWALRWFIDIDSKSAVPETAVLNPPFEKSLSVRKLAGVPGSRFEGKKIGIL